LVFHGKKAANFISVHSFNRLSKFKRASAAAQSSVADGERAFASVLAAVRTGAECEDTPSQVAFLKRMG